MTEPSKDEEYRVPVYVHQTWWAPILLAMGGAVMTWIKFRDFEELEAGTRLWVRVAGFEKTAYQLGGKWAVVGCGVPLVLFFLGVGIYRVAKDRKGLS